ncbi:Kinesin-like protein kif24 [Rhizophlyctis rosea]|nr:Kinesin-like protein kif24 [Rhizophlyctis rosea]
MSTSNNGSEAFRPPPAFVQASLARQAKIKESQQLRAAALAAADNDLSYGESSPKRPGHASPPRSTSAAGGLVSASKSPSTLSTKPLSQPNTPPRRISPHTTPAASPSPSPSPSPLTTPSKTVLHIASLQQRREERRKQQEAVRKAKEGVDERQWEVTRLEGMIEEWRNESWKEGRVESLENDQDADEDMKIRVCVRKRPINEKELSTSSVDILTTRTAIYPDAAIYVHEPKTRLDLSKTIDTHRFMFDNVFDESATNAEVYDASVKGLVEGMFSGGRMTLFAYGQTGSGKTHTIFGTPTDPGLFHHICHSIILLHSTSSNAQTLHLTFFELYGPQVYDLLSSRTRVTLLDSAQPSDPIHIQNLTSIAIHPSEKGLQTLLSNVEKGFSERSTGSTEANADSSRSHAVIQLTLRSKITSRVTGKLSLIDLAGSERGSERGDVSRSARWESSEINKSLLALKECIRALHRVGNDGAVAPAVRGKSDAGKHIPFRASKLTHILRDSFVGRKSRTVMIATVSPGSGSAEHTLNTLRYAGRVKGFGERVGGGRRVGGRVAKVETESGDVETDEGKVEGGIEVDVERRILSSNSTPTDSGTSTPSSKSPWPTPPLDISAYIASHTSRPTSPTPVPRNPIHQSHQISLTALTALLEAEKRLLSDAVEGEYDDDEYVGKLEELIGRRMAIDEELLEVVGKVRGGGK